MSSLPEPCFECDKRLEAKSPYQKGHSYNQDCTDRKCLTCRNLIETSSSSVKSGADQAVSSSEVSFLPRDSNDTIATRKRSSEHPRASLVQHAKRHRGSDGKPKLSNIVRTIIETQREIQTEENSFSFPPLSIGQDIRILRIAAGEGADPIQGTLRPYSFDQHRSSTSDLNCGYEALSYHWGDDDKRLAITISVLDTPKGGHIGVRNIRTQKFLVRPNLYDALMHLRKPADDVDIWVDAICINQGNDRERAEQVSKMHQIYSRATNVCIWLGAGGTKDVQLRETFKTIEQILDFASLERLTKRSRENTDIWKRIVALMTNKWFSRRWVIQELALAQDATVHYGEELIRWTDFADAIALIGTKYDQIKTLLADQRVYSSDLEVVDMSALGASTLVEATNDLFRRSYHGLITERLLTIEGLVSMLLPFEAGDPRDTIYAILSIAKDTPFSAEGNNGITDHPIQADYSKSFLDVCVNFTKYCVDSSESLDIICRYWAPQTIHKSRKWEADSEKEKKTFNDIPEDGMPIPSWIGSIKKSAFGPPDRAMQGRINGDSLVGRPNRQNHRNYNASKGLRPYAVFGIEEHNGDNNDETEGLSESGSKISRVTSEFSDAPETDNSKRAKRRRFVKSNPYRREFDGTLEVKGQILSKINALSPRAADGMILRESLEMGKWTDTFDESPKLDSSGLVSEELWRTLVADRGPKGDNTPTWYRRACMECLTHVTRNGDLNTEALLNTAELPETIKKFLKRVQSVIWNRKFLRTEGWEDRNDPRPHFGLAPTSAREGDVVCILYGCSVPVILRRTHPSVDENDYTFVGEAYIYGMMDGEALGEEKLEFPYKDSTLFRLH